MGVGEEAERGGILSLCGWSVSSIHLECLHKKVMNLRKSGAMLIYSRGNLQ